MKASIAIHGTVVPGFEPVAEAFEDNFAVRGELGAAVAVVADGRTVVDLWGGLADRTTRRPWTHDTMQVIFSITKGLTGVCLLKLIESGQLELDAPIADLWPEFAACGKRDVLVRHAIGHEAGMPGIREPIAVEDVTDDRRMARLLAEQPAEWPAGTQICYHPMTFGWLTGELVRRIDGRSIGTFFAEEVAEPLGLEAWIGLPDEHEPRLATLERARNWGQNLPMRRPAPPDPLFRRVWVNPDLFSDESLVWNRRAIHAAEIAGANGICTARSAARLLGCLASGGTIDGLRLLRPETVELAGRCLSRGTDPLMHVETAYGIGFGAQTAEMPYGPSAANFGAGGAGGSFTAAWPEHSLGFAYLGNEMRDDNVDMRRVTLLDALHRAVVTKGADIGDQSTDTAN